MSGLAAQPGEPTEPTTPSASAESGDSGAPAALRVERFVCGPLDNNVYLLTAPGERRALLVDAPLEATRTVQPVLQERGLTLETIVLTHAHWDHVAEASTLAGATGAQVLIHRQDAADVARHRRSLLFPDVEAPAVAVARELYEGDTVAVGDLALTVIHTPGHTPGSLCLYRAEQHLLLSGDTLFAGSYGRVDLPGGDMSLLLSSLRRLGALPVETVVLPGHGAGTTIEAESWLRRPPLAS